MSRRLELHPFFLATALLVSACSGESSDQGGAGASSDIGEGAAPPVIDPQGGAPPEIDDPEGCSGIDFLFVIDNSASMNTQQNRLRESVTGFMASIQASLTRISSYHVGVITSDAFVSNAPGCNQLGDLVTQSETGVCTPFASGGRYLTEADDLETTFPCISAVGINGSFLERPLSALSAALGPDRSAPGGCNEGFLRENAILVVVLLTDDPPYNMDVDDAHPSAAANVEAWHDSVVQAKGGNADAAVVIGFVPYGNTACVCPWCEGEALPAKGATSPNLISFVQSFGERGVLGSICQAEFASTFQTATAPIAEACNQFVPVK